MKTVNTFTATIYVGLRNNDAGDSFPVGLAKQICQDYVNQVGLCVTVTETTFVYTNGSEPGVIVGLINYPRFPSGSYAIRQHALQLARRLRKGLKQKRVSVVFPNETVMLGNVGQWDEK